MKTRERSTTGVVGLDDVLGGGLPRHRMYLVQGDAGVGKTTLALQYLLEGVRLKESCLYVTLSETPEELQAVARSHRWSLDGIEIHEMGEGQARPDPDEDNTLYVPAEVELGERMKHLLQTVDRVRPARIVIDSCTELRLLAQTPLRFRRQLLALKDDLARRGCTILLLENVVVPGTDPLLQSLVHGIIALEQLSPLYGAERRRLRVTKLREVSYRGGFHDFRIRTGGLQVFPRLVAAEHDEGYSRELASSGVPELDRLLGGGLDRGTSTLLMGPAGSGKSVLAVQFAIAAASRGEKVLMLAFDEGLGTLSARADSLGIPLERERRAERIRVLQVDPAELAPGELTYVLVDAVERHGVKMVIIDSLNGYMHAMPEESYLNLQLHEVLSYLRKKGVIAIVVLAQQGIVGSMPTPVDVSYLADSVILFRYFESFGHVRKAVSVVKKRSGFHETAIRELTLGPGGVGVGEPLEKFRGILTGVPVFEGDRAREGQGGDD